MTVKWLEVAEDSVVLHPMQVDGDGHSNFHYLFIQIPSTYLLEVEHIPLRNLRATPHQKYSNYVTVL